MRTAVLLGSIFAWSACADSAGTSDASVAVDAARVADAAVTVDAMTRTDAASTIDATTFMDATTSIDAAGSPDAVSAPDAVVFMDASEPDAAIATDSGVACEFLDLDVVIVNCPGGYEYARGWQDVNMTPGCAPYATLLGMTYADIPAAVAANGCNGSCLYRASTSVSFIDHCNHRNGYIIFRAMGCPDLYEFSSGLFPNQAAWEEATPCPP